MQYILTAILNNTHTMLDFKQIIAYSTKGNLPSPKRVEHTETEWKALLTEEQFRIARQKGTERPMSSGLCTLYEPGEYACVCCGTALFDSAQKFDSQSGWPSFTEPIENDVLAYHLDQSYGMERIEVTCNVCDAHLGHVFPDGPEPSGLRFCINGACLVKK